MAGTPSKVVVRLFHGDRFAGNVVIHPVSDNPLVKIGDELKISSFSPPSDRCVPLLVLHSIATDGLLFKAEPADPISPDTNGLLDLHSVCMREFKTAIILLEGGNELHLVAMHCKREQWPCFWAFLTTQGLYTFCLSMLNLRCLALVFDLDETLIVANTMRSFEDRIEALDRKIRGEPDSQKAGAMSAELKRYQEDRVLLKQFVEHDHVWDSASEALIAAHSEVVSPLVEGNAPLVRPIVRLQERNMVFTRINPNVRDTSVLVRLRPAWDELRSYITAKGRKRFEVFICTMSEKDYALEMWRLLDPEAQLINVKQLVERVVCVKSGGKKSLVNVFSRGRCHPKMAMVIDDRLKVWEDRDQSHVHVVPAFAPYYAPQAEVNSPVPILCVARNVACNVRGGFFKDFDEGFTKRMSEVLFETDISSLPYVPDVSNYLVLEEEDGPPPYEEVNGIKEFPDVIADAEAERRLKSQAVINTNIPVDRKLDLSLSQGASRPVTFSLLEPQSQSQSQAQAQSQSQSQSQEEEGEVPESELDPDTRRRLLILHHGQDTGQPTDPPPFQLQPSLQVRIPVATPGGWLGPDEEEEEDVEEEEEEEEVGLSPGQFSRSSPGIIIEPESPSFGKQRPLDSPFHHGIDMPEAYPGEERHKPISAVMECSFTDNDDSQGFRTILSSKETLQQSGRPNLPSTSSFVEVLQKIAQQCNAKVDFKPLLNTTKELQFSVEVLFGGDKIGEGIGKTKKEATYRAAENAVRFMASQFVAQAASVPGNALHIKAPIAKPCEEETTRKWSSRDPRILAGLMPIITEEDTSVATSSNQSKILDPRASVEPKRPYDAVLALKKWCTMEGLNVVINTAPMDEHSQQVQAQVEVAGQIVAKGSGPMWEAAKQEAAEAALAYLKSLPSQRTSQKRINFVKSSSFQSMKRTRPGEYMRGIPSPRRSPPRRYARSGPPPPA